MTKLNQLPADQASTLKLLASGKTPQDVAEALAVGLDAVITRAVDGADVLAGDSADSLARSERERVLQSIFGNGLEDPLLKSSPAAMEYANAVRTELGMDTPRPPVTGAQKSVVAPVLQPPPSKAASGPNPPALNESKKPATSREPAESPSVDRRRGIILIACLGIVIVGIIVALVTPGDDSKESTSASSPATTSSAANGGWQIRSRFTLKPVDGGSGKALAGIETKGEASALLIAGNGMTPKTTVGIWLVGGKTAGLVGFQTVNAKGQFSAVGPLPKNLQTADTLVVTSETVKPGQKVPTSPGPVILSSPFSLS